MTARNTTSRIVIETRAVGSNTQQFRGPSIVRAAMVELNVPHMRSRTGGWLECPGKHGEGLMRWLEARGCRLVVVL